MRTLAALVIAPLAVVPVLAVLFGPWALAHGGTPSLLGILAPAIVVSYALAILIGLPAHLVLVHQRRTRWRDYAIIGALLGAVPVAGYYVVAVAFEMKMGSVSALTRNAEWGAIGVAVFGASTAAVAIAFRAIAGRPDYLAR